MLFWIINGLLLINLLLLIYISVERINSKKIKNKIENTKTFNKISNYILLSIKRKILPNRISKIGTLGVVAIMFFLFILAFLVFNIYLQVVSTSIILSIPFFISPIIIIKVLLNKEKSSIIKSLPMYIVNIKSHIADDNNIICAIQRTIVEEPLKKYVDVFKTNISRGMNVIEAFDLLKEEVNISMFTSFINACQVCYLNGGDFNKVLERYIDMITKENIHKEAIKEKAYSDILTLLIMIGLNILVIIMFIFTNEEYAEIIRETFVGRVILNMNAISYILIAYLISRIYKEE